MLVSILHRVTGAGLSLVGLTWAFFQHLFSGIRHLVMDTGAGFELGINRTFAILTLVASVLLTAALWVYVLEYRP
jgi:succinate dehydrogenase / fumarate reductase cytochrome b subunit